MKSMIKLQTYISMLFAVLLFISPQNRSVSTLLWFPKMIAGALSAVIGIIGGLGAFLGIAQRDWKLFEAGVFTAGLMGKFIADIPRTQAQFEPVAQVVQSTNQSSTRAVSPALKRGLAKPKFQQNIVIGEKPTSGKPFLADLWQPLPGMPSSGLGVIYIHGGGWRIGEKDMLTRHFFRRLVGQGHLILDIAYTLWPDADIPTMVREVNQAILWLKDNSQKLGLNPEQIVLMGGSAGGHLALLAAYTPHLPNFKPDQEGSDTSVRGVVAFYPVVDFWAMHEQGEQLNPDPNNKLDTVAISLIDHIFSLPASPTKYEQDSKLSIYNYLIDLLGGTPEDKPETYDLLSPIHHIRKDSPPTLLLQGEEDVFGLTPPVRRMQEALKEAGVPLTYVEYPRTNHGFDLIFPQVNPLAQAATREVEHFLASLA
ncbi:MAG: alpha/beta hydrolase [Chloroflexota bacterium]|nr:MAG: alpha/beta hydrolase [Chloroflexota bacterium]